MKKYINQINFDAFLFYCIYIYYVALWGEKGSLRDQERAFSKLLDKHIKGKNYLVVLQISRFISDSPNYKVTHLFLRQHFGPDKKAFFFSQD